MSALLELEDVAVSFGRTRAVEALSFEVRAGERVALVGESGSGKTVSALAREILENALDERPLGTRTGHLKGRIELTLPRDGFGASLRQRNWRR